MDADTNPLIAMEQELESLRAQKAAIEAKIDVVTKAILVMRPLYGEPATFALGDLTAELEHGLSAGITEQVRIVLRQSGSTWLPPTTIRDYVEKRGVLRAYTNPMAVIHQILRRLKDREEIEEITMTDGGKSYRWKVRDVPRHPAYMPGSVDPLTVPPAPKKNK